MKSLIEKKSFGQICKECIEATSGIDARNRMLSNRTPHRIGVLRMVDAYTPIEKGMRITRHRYGLFSSLFLNHCSGYFVRAIEIFV
jgi:hypothetical protein